MGRRRVLEVELDGMGSLVRGPGSRELIITVTGRPPVWSTIRKGWSLQERTALDVSAAGERRGYDVVTIGRRSRPSVPPVLIQRTPEPEPVADPGEGLW